MAWARGPLRHNIIYSPPVCCDVSAKHASPRLMKQGSALTNLSVLMRIFKRPVRKQVNGDCSEQRKQMLGSAQTISSQDAESAGMEGPCGTGGRDPT